tara:strand:+ start:12557 stop:13153 length:597 start_codon:yes stop_codon:yes gene_type:complete
MKLYMSVNSPYVRIVRVLVRESGNLARVQEIDTNPRDADSGFWSLNPLARIPAMQLPDGTVIAESDLICRYIDEELAGGRFYAPLRQDVRRLSVLGTVQAMLDRGVAARAEQQRPGGPDQKAFIETQLTAVLRGADALDRARFDEVGSPDIADIAVACMVGWMNFRHPQITILQDRPGLADWCARMDARPSMKDTRPG